MKETLFIFSDTIIKRKQKTLYLERVVNNDEEDGEFDRGEYFLDEEFLIPSGDKKYMPIEQIESIVSVGSCRFNSRLLYFLSRNRIPLHVINYRGSYSGSFYPVNGVKSSPALLAQALAFSNKAKRLEIAKSIVDAAAVNTLKNLAYYNNRGRYFSESIDIIEELKNLIPDAETVEELLGIEGCIKRNYYSAWKDIFLYHVPFSKRERNPAPDFINAMISYGNAVLYSFVGNLIYLSKLYPELGYIHSPGENKLSLVYDLADIYKPVIVDRAIFKMVNKNIISEKDFFSKRGASIMKKETKRTFTLELENRFKKKIDLPFSSKRLSFRGIIKNDLSNLLKFITDEHKKIVFYRTQW